jgi:hypothetical protein
MGAPSKRKRKPQDAKALIHGGALPERTVAVCLRQDLVAELQTLERELQEAESTRRAGEGSLASGSASRTLAQEIETAREAMREHTLVFTLRALPRRKFKAMKEEFPPRESNNIDLMGGVNSDAMTDPLVRRCVVEPELDDEDWAELDDKLSDGQWHLLANAAWSINASDVDVPFSRAASRILQTSDDE